MTKQKRSSVENSTGIFEKIKSYAALYIAGLILSGKTKWCTSMAERLGVSHDKIYRFLSKFSCFDTIFSRVALNMIAYYEQYGLGNLIIDDSAISKMHSKIIPGVGTLFNSATKNKSDKGFSVVLLLWSNDVVTIPIAFKFWYGKDVTDESSYRKKAQLAQELLSEYKNKINYKTLLIDCLYNTEELRPFYEQNGIRYVSKMRCNSKIEIDGVEAQIKQHPALKLRRNARVITKKTLYKGVIVFITTYKRKNKDGSFNIIYLASNQNLPSYDYVHFYEKRWCVEVLFRFTKQHLGLEKCAAHKIGYQNKHVAAVFFAYLFLQHEKSRQNLPNIEAVTKGFSDVKTSTVIASIHRFSQFFYDSA
jgi:DDE superfamily endonuclease